MSKNGRVKGHKVPTKIIAFAIAFSTLDVLLFLELL